MACGHMFPSLDCDEQCCCECTSLCGNIYFHFSWIYTWEWNYWVIQKLPKVSKVSAPDSQRMRVPATPLPCQQLTRCIFFIFLISSWNKDCQEEHQQTQICRWYHSKAEREEELKRLLMRVKEGWGIVAQLCLTLCDPSDYICQAPLSMVFSRQEYWNRLPCPFPGKGKRGEWKSWLKAQHSKN